MPRTIPAAVEANVQKPVTEPTWLLHLAFSIPIYATSGVVLPHDSLTFNRQGLRIETVSEDTLSFILRDDDNLVKSIIDIDGIDDIAIVLWQYFESDGVKVWSGFTDGVLFRNHEAHIKGARLSAGSATFPDRFFHRGDFPYMPNDGTVIRWGQHEITLRSG